MKCAWVCKFRITDVYEINLDNVNYSKYGNFAFIEKCKLTNACEKIQGTTVEYFAFMNTEIRIAFDTNLQA